MRVKSTMAFPCCASIFAMQKLLKQQFTRASTPVRHVQNLGIFKKSWFRWLFSFYVVEKLVCVKDFKFDHSFDPPQSLQRSTSLRFEKLIRVASFRQNDNLSNSHFRCLETDKSFVRNFYWHQVTNTLRSLGLSLELLNFRLFHPNILCIWSSTYHGNLATPKSVTF